MASLKTYDRLRGRLVDVSSLVRIFLRLPFTMDGFCAGFLMRFEGCDWNTGC